MFMLSMFPFLIWVGQFLVGLQTQHNDTNKMCV